jgi:colicin import membrane protein
MTEFYQKIPPEPGKKKAMLLAGLMHALLFVFLWIGIHWVSKTPVGVEAEIWDINTRTAAPLPTVTAMQPPPPTEVKKVEPLPQLQVEQEQEREAEIALRREKERAREQKRRLEEQEAKLKEEKQKRLEQLQKEEKKKQELTKLAAQQKVDAQIQRQREDNLRRLTSQLGGTGDAVKSTGNNRVDPGYAGKIAAKIKSNMVFVGADNGANNPTVDFVIHLFPDGSLKGVPRKTKSSGVPAFDDAVERAITKSAPYPADKSGHVPSTIPLTYRLRD